VTAFLHDAAGLWWHWMVPMSVQVAVLAAVVVLLDCLLARRTWPQLKAALWSLVLVKLLLPPSLTSPLSIGRLGGSLGIASGTAAPPEVEGLLVLVPLIWLAGLMTLAGLAVWRYRCLRRDWLGQPAEPLPAWLAEVGRQVAGRLGLVPGPEVRLFHGIPGPAVFGFLRPVVLLPAELMASATRQQVEHVLMHEFAHVRRRDAQASLLCLAVQLVYWFHPVAWLARTRLATLREIGCDLTVAHLLGEVTADYRRTLLHLARRLLPQPQPGRLALLARRSQLLERLDWLERPWHDRPGLRRTVTALVCAVLFVSCVPLARPAGRDASTALAWEEAPAADGPDSPPALADLQGCLQVRYAIFGMLGRQEAPADAR
jgi:bla regulator protein blaR1